MEAQHRENLTPLPHKLFTYALDAPDLDVQICHEWVIHHLAMLVQEAARLWFTIILIL